MHQRRREHPAAARGNLATGRGGRQEAAAAPRRATARREEWFGLGSGALLFGIVIGGLYSGVFTATEAGALGAFTSLLLSAAFVRAWGARRGTTPRRMLLDSLGETGGLTAMIFALIVGATLFTNMLVQVRVPTAVSAWTSPWRETTAAAASRNASSAGCSRA